MILILVAKVFGHVDELDVLRKIESLEEAAQIARGWAECAEWSTKRLKRKGTLTTSQERANLVAIGALVWVGEILSPTS